MELVEIDSTTEDTYYRCLHDELPSDPQGHCHAHPQVELEQISTEDKSAAQSYGESIDVVYINDTPFRPDGPPASKQEFQQAILETFSDPR